MLAALKRLDFVFEQEAKKALINIGANICDFEYVLIQPSILTAPYKDIQSC